MNVLRRIAMAIGGTVAVALVIGLAAPKTVHALVSALVTVANTTSNPVPVQSVDNPALQPFNATGTCSFQIPCAVAQILVVPVGLTAVVQDVSGTCSLESVNTTPPVPPNGIQLTSTSALNVFPDGQIDLTPALFQTQIVTQTVPGTSFTINRAVSSFGFGRRATLYAASTSGAQGSFGFSESDPNAFGTIARCDVNISGYYVKNGQ
ncbi:MAG: hypothetical protein ACYDCM_10365 [Candidatus Acidiferrales bacterium]